MPISALRSVAELRALLRRERGGCVCCVCEAPARRTVPPSRRCHSVTKSSAAVPLMPGWSATAIEDWLVMTRVPPPVNAEPTETETSATRGSRCSACSIFCETLLVTASEVPFGVRTLRRTKRDDEAGKTSVFTTPTLTATIESPSSTTPIPSTSPGRSIAAPSSRL